MTEDTRKETEAVEQDAAGHSPENTTDNEPAASSDVTQADETEEAAGESGLSAREQELLAKIEQLTQEKEENYNKYLRAQADLQNFRARTNKEKEQLLTYSSQRVIEALLPVIDNFDRALSASKEATDMDTLVQGVEMVFRQLQQVLDQEGVTTLPGVGEPFDPNLHQAVMQEESSEYEPGIIIEEFQKGYKLKERVIRPSMVKVSS
ncbi:nucleotide exchange factor GrpE [Aneurinibacillus terranovensis]|uniref:nucleotide exchange factor GrpE n=1 Tax=Aneurinibacillus terranovensis TaxID=278991 RepID=UPI0003FE13A2|nr:nucleotide exchange factor GrpE [Aneurinibacillus terranovensis]